jgi:hypothetical protein
MVEEEREGGKKRTEEGVGSLGDWWLGSLTNHQTTEPPSLSSFPSIPSPITVR